MSYRITSRDGEVISLLQFATSTLHGHYLTFFPWIDVTSWVINGRTTTDSENPEESAVFVGVDHADLHLDHNDITTVDQAAALFLSFDLRSNYQDWKMGWQATVKGLLDTWMLLERRKKSSDSVRQVRSETTETEIGMRWMPSEQPDLNQEATGHTFRLTFIEAASSWH